MSADLTTREALRRLIYAYAAVLCADDTDHTDDTRANLEMLAALSAHEAAIRADLLRRVRERVAELPFGTTPDREHPDFCIGWVKHADVLALLDAEVDRG